MFLMMRGVCTSLFAISGTNRFFKMCLCRHILPNVPFLIKSKNNKLKPKKENRSHIPADQSRRHSGLLPGTAWQTAKEQSEAGWTEWDLEVGDKTLATSWSG